MTCLARVSWLISPTSFFFAVAQAASWRLCLHSSHECCSVSSVLIASPFLQEAHRALSAWSGILLQDGPHFILLVSTFLMWHLRRGGTPRAFVPVMSFLFVSLRRVACCILFLASSSLPCHRMGRVLFISALELACMRGGLLALVVWLRHVGRCGCSAILCLLLSFDFCSPFLHLLGHLPCRFLRVLSPTWAFLVLGLIRMPSRRSSFWIPIQLMSSYLSEKLQIAFLRKGDTSLG